MALPPDLIELLAVFAEEKVDYLLIGGQALALHGHPRFTKDADLWLRDDVENLRRAHRPDERRARGKFRRSVEPPRDTDPRSCRLPTRESPGPSGGDMAWPVLSQGLSRLMPFSVGAGCRPLSVV